MITRFAFFTLLVLVSCGQREVKFPNGAEAISPYSVTNAERIQTDADGHFTKAATLNGSTISTGGKSYPFSEYSSYQALTYYSKKSLGSTYPVKFRGEVVNGKMIVELIEDK